jgi:hypothetical protein
MTCSSPRRTPLALTLLGALLLCAPALAAPPTPREVKEVLESRDATRIRALLAGLRGHLDEALVRTILESGEPIYAAGVYDDTIEVLGTATGKALEALADGYSRARRSPTGRFMVLDALSRVTDPLAPKTLSEAARTDAHPGVATYAVRLLARRGDARSIDELLEVLRSAGAAVAREAETALAGVTGQDLRGHDAWSRWWASERAGWDRRAGAGASESGGGADGGTQTRSVLDRLRERRPGDLRTLERLQQDEILVFEGEYDKVQDVLTELKLPHQVHPRAAIETLTFAPRRQVLVFNCAADPITPAAAEKVRAFVCQGGYVFSSDWELGNVLVKSFPEAAVSGGRRSAEHSVRIIPPQVSMAHPLLRDVFPLNPWEAESRKLMWAVDGLSEFFQPNAALTVLAEAAELQPLYGSTIVAATFAYGPNGKPFTGEVRRRPPRRPTTGGNGGASGDGTRERGGAPETPTERDDAPHPGRVLHVVSHVQHQTNEAGDGYALQQLLVNFVIEKQEARRGN